MSSEQKLKSFGKMNVGKRLMLPLIITLIMGISYILKSPDMVRFAVGGLFLVMLLLVKEENSFYLMMFVLSANEMLNFGSTSIAMIFVMLYAVKSVFFSGFKFRIYKSVAISLFVLLLVSVMADMLGIKEQMMATIKLIFFLYYTARVLEKNVDNRKTLYTNSFRFVALGLNFFSIVAVLIGGFPSLTERFTFHADVTINFLAIISAIAIINLLYIIVVLRSEHVALDMLLIVGCCVWGILTQSRTFILAVAIGALLLFFFASSRKQREKMLFGIAIAVLICAIFLSIVPGAMDRIQVVIERIINPKNDDVSNGRYEIWKHTISEMVNQGYSWFGAGDYTLLNAVYLDKVEVAHNFLIETWVIYGFIGCAILIAVFFSFIRCYVFNMSKTAISAVSLIPLIVVLCALFYSHHFIGRSFCMVFILSWLPLTFERSKSVLKGG